MSVNSTGKRAMLLTCIIIITSTLVFSAIYIPLSLKNSNAWTSSNISGNVVEVGDLYASSGGGDSALNDANIMKLNQYLFGKNHNPSTLSRNLTAADIRNAGNGGKGQGQSVIVNLGGKKWTIMYVSQAKNGDIIATMWLTESTTTSTFGNNGGAYGANSALQAYPTNMYGTSYIRAVALNNGGSYVDVTGNSPDLSLTSTNGGVPSKTHTFAPFTVADASTYPGLTDYIVKPVDVSWQENGQSTINTLGWANNCSNENWTDEKTGATADEQFYYYRGYYNWAGKSGNSTWKDDYIWLPSMTEVGYTGDSSGMWGTNQNERSNGIIAWLRTAGDNNTRANYYPHADGAAYDYEYVNYDYGVRPALHWNLSATTYRAANFNISVASENAVAGTISGGSTYAALSGEKYYVNGSNLQVGDATFSPVANSGYRFDGWYIGGTKITQTSANPVLITSSMNVTAKFFANTYTITYNGNGATGGSTANSAHTYDVAKNLTANGYARAGYTFLGWNTNSAATAAAYSNGQSVTNLTTTNGATIMLYAIWRANTYTIIYNGNGADSGSMANSSHTYDTAKNLSKNTFAKLNCIFLGWSTDSTATAPQHLDEARVLNWTMTDGATITLYAIWKFVYSLDISVSIANAGEVMVIKDDLLTTAGIFDSGTKLKLVALANTGYTFRHWEVRGTTLTAEQSVANKLEIAMNSNIEVTAVFENATVSGVYVTATKGGMAYIVGDDFENLTPEDEIIFRAKLALEGYAFSHWEDASGNVLGAADSIKLKKSQVMNGLITAVFVPMEDDPNVNDDTGNV